LPGGTEKIDSNSKAITSLSWTKQNPYLALLHILSHVAGFVEILMESKRCIYFNFGGGNCFLNLVNAIQGTGKSPG